MNATQYNTITSLISNEIQRCYREARLARGKGWPETERRWFSRADDLRATDKVFQVECHHKTQPR